jgi:hypothetical protein
MLSNDTYAQICYGKTLYSAFADTCAEKFTNEGWTVDQNQDFIQKDNQRCFIASKAGETFRLNTLPLKSELCIGIDKSLATPEPGSRCTLLIIRRGVDCFEQRL